jgi:hypothetical protein
MKRRRTARPPLRRIVSWLDFWLAKSWVQLQLECGHAQWGLRRDKGKRVRCVACGEAEREGS